jgi:hypothetical protein
MITTYLAQQNKNRISIPQSNNDDEQISTTEKLVKNDVNKLKENSEEIKKLSELVEKYKRKR